MGQSPKQQYYTENVPAHTTAESGIWESKLEVEENTLTQRQGLQLAEPQPCGSLAPTNMATPAAYNTRASVRGMSKKTPQPAGNSRGKTRLSYPNVWLQRASWRNLLRKTSTPAVFTHSLPSRKFKAPQIRFYLIRVGGGAIIYFQRNIQTHQKCLLKTI